MSRSRAPIFIGTAAVTGIGYYLYQAGGDGRAAEKKFESDIHKASAEVKSHLPTTTQTNAQKDLKTLGSEAGAKVDNAIAEADKQASVAKSNIEAYAKEARAEGMKAVDKFDHKVEEGVNKAKGGLSSWFGSSK